MLSVCLRQVGRPRAAQSLGKRLMTTGLVVGTFNSVLAGEVNEAALTSAGHLQIWSCPVAGTMHGSSVPSGRSCTPTLHAAVLDHAALNIVRS